jgi:hypothetical protein
MDAQPFPMPYLVDRLAAEDLIRAGPVVVRQHGHERLDVLELGRQARPDHIVGPRHALERVCVMARGLK